MYIYIHTYTYIDVYIHMYIIHTCTYVGALCLKGRTGSLRPWLGHKDG